METGALSLTRAGLPFRLLVWSPDRASDQTFGGKGGGPITHAQAPFPTLQHLGVALVSLTAKRSLPAVLRPLSALLRMLAQMVASALWCGRAMQRECEQVVTATPTANDCPSCPCPPSLPAEPPLRPAAFDLRGTRVGGERVTWIASPNQGAAFAAGLPDMIVVHYTAGGSMAGAVTTLTTPTSQASAHVVIGRDGALTQLVPCDRVAWHAGESAWQGQTHVNRRALGLELVNWGWLTHTGPLEDPEALWGWCDSVSGRLSGRVDREDAVLLRHKHGGPPRWWQVYPAAQVAALTELGVLLTRAYPIRWVVGHEDVAPLRKVDPGPAFPLDDLRARLPLRVGAVA